MRLSILVVLVLSVAALGSTSIESDLKDFYNLLPSFRIRELVAKHYSIDTSFRKCFKFLKSNEFRTLLRQDFAKSPEVQDIIKYLDAPVTLDFIESSLRSLSVPDHVLYRFARQRSVIWFVHELIELLPFSKLKQMIAQKDGTNMEFHDFYESISEPVFKELVYRARNADSMKNAVRKLESNEIRVDKILQSVFAVLDKLKKN